ncbi:MAG: hypothetical protein P0Y56_03950 [Candidatus Andeanibacterium colombiense]|uniref:Uncharacterized protein n=1 Tax=Candidatus Andeanibacterium colombiense TaxID=3121345 RepID=A0AAJ6BNV4_9SPHN|nr:MAG: hypothetical protein P0Y56_03950 [Sphingomonadaceae bacterium]
MHLSNTGAFKRHKLSLPFGRPTNGLDDKRAAATLSALELRRLVAAMVD